MAYYKYDLSKSAGSRLRSAVALLENIRQTVGEFKTMQAMLSGDGSQDAHYDVIAAEYGFRDAAGSISTSVAHGAYGVFAAAAGRLDSDGSVDTVKSSNENCVIQLRG